jgi:hypothetical protein
MRGAAIGIEGQTTFFRMRTFDMISWLIAIGTVLAVIGLLLLSPLADFLPVDWWSLSTRKDVGYRVVPVPKSYVLELSLIGIGLALIGVGLRLKSSKSRKQ